MPPAAADITSLHDAELIAQSLAGDRRAFGQIVGRYQSLVCALAFSATGNRSRSEDLAQETFLTAWLKLRDLREPARLRAWLCGIARNIIHSDLRRLERQPAHEATSLDAAQDLSCAEPTPPTMAVSNEEIALLWREVGRLPESYREPLVLYYREHRSVENVAAALELTPDAVMQRLSRGRHLLQARMLVFVESTLERTNPGAGFTQHVQAVLPVLVTMAPATAAGVASPAGALKGGTLGFLLAWLTPLIGVFAAIGITWTELARAPSARERRYLARWMLLMWLWVTGLVVAMPAVARLTSSERWKHQDDWLATAPFVALWFTFITGVVTIVIMMSRGRAKLRRELSIEKTSFSAPPARRAWISPLATLLAVLVSIFWAPLFLSWEAGDRAVSLAIAVGILGLAATPLVLFRCLPQLDEARFGSWFLAGCGLLFLLVLNVRLDVWLATFRGVDLPTMHRLLPMPLIHGLSSVVVAWGALLVFVTKPAPRT